MRFIAVASLAFVFGVPASEAGVLSVPKSFPTIQSAVDSASPGDTIAIRRGTYREHVIVPAGKDGLRIKAVGVVVIEPAALPGGGLDLAPLLEIGAAHVVVERLVVRHAQAVAISVKANDVRLSRLKVLHAKKQAIVILGDHPRVERTLIAACRSGLRIEGDGASIDRSAFRLVPHAAIDADGDAARVTRCSFVSCADSGGPDDPGVIVVAGHSARIEKNKIVSAASHGIHLIGRSPIVRLNRVSEIAPQDGGDDDVCGIYVDASAAVQSSATIERNVLASACHAAIRHDGSGATIRANVIRGGPPRHPSTDWLPGSIGIVVNAASDGAEIIRNVVRDVGTAMLIRDGSTAVVLIENRALACGTVHGAAFDVHASGSTLSKNVATDSNGDGFRIGADAKLSHLVANRALRCLGDGFDVDASECALEKNVAIGNHAEGFDNGGEWTVLVGSLGKQNRIDIANSGSFSKFDSNTFTTGGASALPQVD